MRKSRSFVIWAFFAVAYFFSLTPIAAQHDDSHAQNEAHEHHTEDLCAHVGHHEGDFDPGSTAFHHIADPNLYSIGVWNFPLPCILYNKDQGWDIFMSSKFDFDFRGHGDGHKAYRGYVLDGGRVMRIKDGSLVQGEAVVGGFAHLDDESYACIDGTPHLLEAKSTMDGGFLGGGITSFYDFSITKNVVGMLLIVLLLGWLFLRITKAYQQRDGMAPKGVQSFIEPIFLFIQDEVAKPFLGDKWPKFQPLLMALFFFILALNLFGQIPFLGGVNVTGNLAVTMALALIAFIVTNINGKKPYWEHILWMPGVPGWVKFIITPVEILGLFIKPLTLMLRLFANITAGHIVVLTFVGLIFIFGQSGQSYGGSAIGIGLSIPLTLFMLAIELLVAFIQAFVFTILTASYIGAATEDAHH
ncbi:MAG: F0F1 ATP synthase subunit A [Saprospiraceae bacterium]|nr:F0F1 ATP synthase subunit A [Saprospiraceae bacterium]